MSVVAIVAWPEDALAKAVERTLGARHRSTTWLEPGTLAGLRVSLDGEGLEVEGRSIGGVLWRVRPDSDFSSDFAEDDRPFADVETRAFWLAALHSGRLRAPFRPEAAAFFTGAGWLFWRRRLVDAGVRVSPLGYGAAAVEGEWLPYHHDLLRPYPGAGAAALLGAAILRRASDGRALMVGSEVIESETGATPREANVLAAAGALRGAGLVFGEIGLDSEHAVLTVNPFPVLRDPPLVTRVASVLAELLDASADRR